MKQKIIVKGPVLSQSGYGEQARFALRALRTREDIFDIYIIPTAWGQTGWVSDLSEERTWLDEKIRNAHIYVQQKGQFDISLQITIPNEWEKIAPVNIGYTAGIETTKVAPIWLQKANEMDKIIVVSNHSKDVFENTNYQGQDPNTGQVINLICQTPVEVVNYPVRNFEKESLKLKLDYNFNYLAISQWGPRKNFDNLVRWFLEENFDQEVGLVVKTSVKNNSLIDREHTQARLKSLMQQFGGEECKCKVYLIHGDLTPGEMNGLYQHSKIKALISTAHGEGYGLPLFEAAYNGLPVIVSGWSGHCDFLYVPDPRRKNKKKPMFASVEYDLQNVQKEAVWESVIQADSQWAFPREASFKRRLREVRNEYSRFKRNATKLKKHIIENFTEEEINNYFCESILKGPDHQTEEVTGISFCISTNGAKPKKTNLEIKSIQETMKSVKIPYEIIVAGATTLFGESEEVKLVNTPNDAHGGLLAKLRNNAAEKAKYKALVFVDDDFLFPPTWANRLVEFSKTSPWKILGNKIKLPDGDRFWDRAIMNPHMLVSYDHTENDKRIYQTGGFWIMRADVFGEHPWDASIKINSEKQGGINEDIEMSIRMHKNGFPLSFDKENFVWHDDDSYSEYDVYTLKKEQIAKILDIEEDFLYKEPTREYSDYVEYLSNK